MKKKELIICTCLGLVAGFFGGRISNSMVHQTSRYEIREVQFKINGSLMQAVKIETATGKSWGLSYMNGGWIEIPDSTEMLKSR